MLLAILDNIFNQKHYLKLTKEVRKWLRKERNQIAEERDNAP